MTFLSAASTHQHNDNSVCLSPSLLKIPFSAYLRDERSHLGNWDLFSLCEKKVLSTDMEFGGGANNVCSTEAQHI